MTTSAGESQRAIVVQYEGPAPSFGGFDSADFALDRPNQHVLEVNLRLSSDARALFESALAEAGAEPLNDTSVQALMRVIGEHFYGALPPDREIPPIVTLRARDIDPGGIGETLREAGLL